MKKHVSYECKFSSTCIILAYRFCRIYNKYSTQ